MMIENDHVNAAILQPLDGFNRSRSTIHRQEKPDGEFLQTVRHAIGAEAVAFLQSMREIVIHAPAHPPHKLGQEGRRCDAIHIVVTENDERFIGFPGTNKPADGRLHIGQEKGIRESLELGIEKLRGGRGLGKPSLQQALGEKWGDAETLDQRLSQQGLRRADGPAELHDPAAGGVRLSNAVATTDARIEVRMIPITKPSDRPIGISICQMTNSIFTPI